LTPKGLPEPTALNGAPIAPDAVIHREEVPFRLVHDGALRRGEALRIIDDSGRASVSLIGWREEDPPSGSIAPTPSRYSGVRRSRKAA
jgi:uncharacterized protein YcgI (DUF1989 family)